MNEAKFPESLRQDLWTECANTATDVDNIIVSDKISPYQAFHGSPSKIIKKLRVFGEMGVIKNHSVKFQSKLKDKGAIVMFVGYADSHSADVYRFLKMGTVGLNTKLSENYKKNQEKYRENKKNSWKNKSKIHIHQIESNESNKREMQRNSKR